MPDRDGIKSSAMLPKIQNILNNASLVGPDLVFNKLGGGSVNAGRVRGTDGTSGPLPKLYSAKGSSGASLTSGTITLLSGWSFVEGTSSLVTYDGNTNFTLTETGIYIIIGSVTFSSNPTGRRLLLMYINGADGGSKARMETSSGGTACTPQFQYVGVLNAGTVLTLRAYQSSGATLSVSNPVPVLQILKLA